MVARLRCLVIYKVSEELSSVETQVCNERCVQGRYCVSEELSSVETPSPDGVTFYDGIVSEELSSVETIWKQYDIVMI